MRVKGHAFKEIQTNGWGDKRYLCECGETGSPMGGTYDARLEHRAHKAHVRYWQTHPHTMTIQTELDYFAQRFGRGDVWMRHAKCPCGWRIGHADKQILISKIEAHLSGAKP